MLEGEEEVHKKNDKLHDRQYPIQCISRLQLLRCSSGTSFAPT